MRTQEGETIFQYCGRIKGVANVIRGSKGMIDDETAISKVLRTLLPIYAIRVSTIQELRCTPSSNMTLEGLVGRHIAFELSNFDNFTPSSIYFSFKSKLTLEEFKDKKKKISNMLLVTMIQMMKT